MAQVNPSSLLLSAILGGSFVVATAILGGSVQHIKASNNVIKVTGSASEPITSDLIIWAGTVSSQSTSVGPAYSKLKQDVAAVSKYLVANGIQPSEIETDAISESPLYEPLSNNNGDNSNTFRKILAYSLSQRIRVTSKNVDLVDKVSRASTDLIAQGINFESDPPKYLYTQIGAAKIQILAAAANDCRKRAEAIAKNSGADLGQVTYARMSPLQIQKLYSTDVSSDGEYDTSSKQKQIMAIITMGFKVK